MRSIESILLDLRRISIDNHRCFGCGHEHSCSVHGCAIIREGMELIRSLRDALSESEQARSELAQRMALAQSRLYDAEQAAATVRRCLSATQNAMDEARVKDE